MNTFKMEVNTKVAGEYKLVGTVDVPMFSLAEFGLDIEPTSTDAETGLLVYGDEKVNYVYNAIVAATKADARGKLQPGTANLKPNSTIASTVEELIAKAERNGAALALNREFLADFATYLKNSSGKADKVQALYNAMVKNRASIPLSSTARKDGLMVQLQGFVDASTPELATKYSNILSTLGDLCEGTEELDDGDL